MIGIRYASPFAVFRDFTAGYFRSTFRFSSYSALYGLLLNIAGIEMRGKLGNGPTEVRKGLPSFEVASAVVCWNKGRHSFDGSGTEAAMPGSAVLFQQLHALPVGATNKHRIPLTKGNKHHISPGRRQVLVGLKGLCYLRGHPEVEELLRVSLETAPDKEDRYGLPFLGDNSFMLEELDLLRPEEEFPVSWVVRDEEEDDFDLLGFPEQASSSPFRLTIWADRVGMSETRSDFFVTETGVSTRPPDSAWVRVGPPVE